nr:TPA_asm: hypothetical protein [Becan tricladivirus 1]
MQQVQIRDIHTAGGLLKIFVISSVKLLRICFNRTFGFISGILGSYFFYYVSKPIQEGLFCTPLKYSYRVCEAIFNSTD